MSGPTDDERREFKRSELRRAQEMSGEFAGMVRDPDRDKASLLGAMAVHDLVAKEPIIPQEDWDQAVDTSGLRRVGDCGHQRIERFTGGDNAFSIWACGDCKLRFYPACSTCVDVGHRNVVHPESVHDYGSTKPWSEVRARLTGDTP